MPDTCLAPYFPDVVLSDFGAKVTVDFFFNGAKVLTEIYDADNDGIAVVRGLSDFLSEQFDGIAPSLVPGSTQDPQVGKYLRILATPTLSDGTVDSSQSPQQSTCLVFPARAKVGSPFGKFLTTCGRRELYDESFYLSFYAGDYNLTYTIVPSVGAIVTKSFAISAGDGSERYDYVLSRDYLYRLANLAAGVSVVRFIAQLQSKSGTVLDTYSVDFFDSPRRFSKAVYFDNVYLAPDVAVFRGSLQESMPYEANVLRFTGKLRRVASDVHKEFTLNSGLLSSAEYGVAVQTLEADNVIVQDETVVVIGAEVENAQPKEKPSVFVLKYRLADKPIVSMERKEEPGGIFSTSFDNAFD